MSGSHSSSNSTRRRKTGGFAVLALVFALTTGAVGAASAQDAEPPALVGRVAGIDGDVSMHRVDQTDWSEAGVNEPLTVGDALYAKPGASARLEIGGADIVLKDDSEIDIAALDQDSGRLRLDSGALDLRVRALPTENGLYIATPRGTVRVTEPGTYRIEAGSEDDPTRVIAWDGAAEMGDSGSAVAIQPGQTLVISGPPDTPRYAYSNDSGPPPRDWPSRRVAAQRYVPPAMTGADDLDQYGDWQPSPDYGPVWYPSSVPTDWAPYRNGHWAFVAPWGWTWVDDAPWGFAPFHYGRWAFIGNRWGWCPGEYVARPIYAPALVAFVGGGLNVSLSFGRDRPVGWVPLAPGEFYRPPYRARDTYIENINRTIAVRNGPDRRFNPADRDRHDFAGAFANQRFATVVPADAMRRARPVAQAAISVPSAELAKARIDPQIGRTIVPATPERRAGRPGPVALPPNPAIAATTRPPLMPRGGRGQGFEQRGGAPSAPAIGAPGPAVTAAPPQPGSPGFEGPRVLRGQRATLQPPPSQPAPQAAGANPPPPPRFEGRPGNFGRGDQGQRAMIPPTPPSQPVAAPPAPPRSEGRGFQGGREQRAMIPPTPPSQPAPPAAAPPRPENRGFDGSRGGREERAMMAPQPRPPEPPQPARPAFVRPEAPPPQAPRFQPPPQQQQIARPAPPPQMARPQPPPQMARPQAPPPQAAPPPARPGPERREVNRKPDNQ